MPEWYPHMFKMQATMSCPWGHKTEVILELEVNEETRSVKSTGPVPCSKCRRDGWA